jgi:predicted metalloendopeptidase
MDLTCKPCTDFWRYANGGWLDKNPIPANHSDWGVLSVLLEANRERMRTILDASASAGSGSGNYHKMGDLYASCMNTAAIDKLGLEPVRADLDRIAAIQSKSDLVAALIASQAMPKLTFSNSLAVGLFRLRAMPDLKNPRRYIAAIVERDSPGLYPSSVFSLPDRDYYLKQDAPSREVRDAFILHVARVLQLAGASEQDSAAQAKSVLALETAYAPAVMTIADRRDPDKTYHLMDVKALAQLAPDFDWAQLLRTYSLAETTPILVSEPEMMRKFNALLRETPLATWKTWLRWRTLQVASPYLSQPFFDEDFHFEQTTLQGVREPLPRWETCADMVELQLSDALGQAWTSKYFPPESKQRMLRLAEDLRAAMKDEIERAAWMTPATRQNALKKLAAIAIQVGYPDRWKDYSSIVTDRGRFYDNARGAWRFEQSYALAKIGKPSDRIDWSMPVPEVNAYSNPLQVKAVFPAGILQPPYFDPTADDAANYGAIGAVIGHEIGHLFDDSGSKFDDTGALRNWWTDEDRRNFENRAGCIVAQYDAIDVGGGQHHNGRQVLGEAMGDLGGVETAYRAWKKSLSGKPAPEMDGYTGDQRFFIAYAHVWESQMRAEAERLQVTAGNHPLAKWRANATLMNMPEFQAAFHCKPGDAMTRPAAQRCTIW